jgi:hypothetical protein
MVCAQRAQMQNVYFLENDFTGHTDSIVLRYSVTKNGLLSNNQFSI